MEASRTPNWRVLGRSDLGRSGHGALRAGIRRDDVLDTGVDCANECGCCIGSCDDARHHSGRGKEMATVREILSNPLLGATPLWTGQSSVDTQSPLCA